ncbi:MAG: sugar phosphate nucleotidyltransferase [Thaumarchaeota archaeon]|nr:sugar phosphate nucleotidyltransferase [Nitrososphaerota archaeon]
MQAVIFAGGLGTRLRPLTDSVPKPMVPVNGKPFLEHELQLLCQSGIREFVLCVGYLGKVIQEYFGDGGKFGVRLEYSFDGDQPLGVAGALKRAAPLLQDTFFATYGDSYLRADYSVIMEEFRRTQKLGMMLVYENHNAYGRSDLAVKDGLVTKYNKRNQTPDMVWINYGVSFLRKVALDIIPVDHKCYEEEFYGELIKRKELLAKVVQTRFFEIGTLSALKEFEEFLVHAEKNP